VLRFVLPSANTDMLIATSEKINDLSNPTRKELSMQSNFFLLYFTAFCGVFISVFIQINMSSSTGYDFIL